MKRYNQIQKFSNRSLFDKLIDYRYILSFFTIISFICMLFYISITDKIYRSDMTIEIIPQEAKFESTKINPIKNSDYERYFQTQMDFLKSRYLISKVVKEINSNIKFYQKNEFKFYKSFNAKLPIEIKRFEIKDNSFYKRMFYLKIIDKTKYKLYLVKNKFLKDELTKPIVCNFGDTIKTNYFNMKIEKNNTLDTGEIYFKVIPSYMEINSVIKRLNIIRMSDKSSFIKIYYDDTSAFMAKKFLEKLLEIYKNMLNKSQINEADNYSKVLDNEIKKVKKELAENEKKLLSFSKNNQTSGIKKQTDNLIDQIYKDEDRLNDLEIKYQTLRTILVMVKNVDRYNNILTLLGDIDNKNLPILVNAILEEEKIYQKYKEKYKELHPKMIELKRSITIRKIALKKNLVELFKSVKKQREKLIKEIKNKKDSLTDVPSKEIGLLQLKRERDRLEKLYISLKEKKTKIKLSEKINKNYILRLVDSPYIPTYHIKPKGLLLLILSIFIGLILGTFFALIIDYFKKKIVVPADIEENSFIPLLGIVTQIRDKKLYNSLFVTKKPMLIASKMMWELRNSIEQYKSDGNSIVICVTSMIRGEGKTTIASNLATALGQGDKKVIVVSLDLRLPDIHRRFGVTNRFGITSVMFDNVDINNVIKRVKKDENLYILPSGPIPTNAVKVVNSKFMDQLIFELRKVFDYIVIDLAPITVAPETVFMMKKSDLNLVVLKSNYSDKKFLLHIEEIVKKNGIKNIAFVLNGLFEKYVDIISRRENRMYGDF